MRRSSLRTSYIPQKEDSSVASVLYAPPTIPGTLEIQILPLQLCSVASAIWCGLFYNSLDIAIDFSVCQRDFKNPDYSRKEFNANNSTMPDLHKEQEEGFSSFSQEMLEEADLHQADQDMPGAETSRAVWEE